MHDFSRPRTVDTPQGPVEYTLAGEGPAVVCLHGAMGGHDQSEILAHTIGPEGYRYIAVSRPGYLGTPLSSGVSPQAQADLLAALLDGLEVEAVGVMAVSGGGPCALYFAHRHTGRCRGLVLVSTCADVEETPIPWTFKLTTWLARWPVFVNFVRRKTESDPDRAARRSIPDDELRRQTLDDPRVGPLFRALLVSTVDRMNLRLEGCENDIHISRSCTYPLEEIHTPTLVVHGTRDQMLGFEKHARGFETRMPDAELLAVQNGDHVSIFTHNDSILPGVSGFLEARIRGGSGS